LAAAALAVGILLAAPGRAAGQAPDEIGIGRGSTPSPLVLEKVDGDRVDLGEYFGRRPVLLEFWATWCENCEALHPRMQEAHARYGDRVAFFAIAVAVGQSRRSVRLHLEKRPVAYPTLWDGTGQAVREFRTPATSYIVILDAGGRVAYTGMGRDQDLDAAIRALPAAEDDG
jgi:thiol-disulfide isomerase/thioredoxin